MLLSGRSLSDGGVIVTSTERESSPPTVIVDRLISILHHVCAGVGIGILPSGCLPDRQWGEGFHAAQLTEPALSVSVGLITARGRYLTPAASGMVSLIREQMNKSKS